MKTLILCSLILLSLPSAFALNCVSVDGSSKFSAYWGHGGAWLQLNGQQLLNASGSNQGRITSVRVSPNLLIFVLALEGTSKFTLLNFSDSQNPSEFLKSGILVHEGKTIYFDCP